MKRNAEILLARSALSLLKFRRPLLAVPWILVTLTASSHYTTTPPSSEQSGQFCPAGNRAAFIYSDCIHADHQVFLQIKRF
jgi:hypothetical protein